jgi:hypothetical protein
MASGALGIWAGSIILQPPEQLKSPINLVIGEFSGIITVNFLVIGMALSQDSITKV